MTPLQADLAFVLEGIPGVSGLYALAPKPYAGTFEVAVQLRGPQFLDAARCAVYRVLERGERWRVLFVAFEGGMSRSTSRDATLLVLTDEERQDARRRTEALANPRRLRLPPRGAPFTALLVDVDEEVQAALRRIYPGEARHVMRRDPEEAGEMALTMPFHLLLCGVRPALARRSLLSKIAREDPDGANRVVLVAPMADVPHLRWSLQGMERRNPVLPLPVDDVLLRGEVFRDQPELAATLAVAEVARVEPPAVSRRAPRRGRVLVIDDHPTTEVLCSAASPSGDVEVVLATTPMDAFGEVVSAKVDLVLCSAAMRGDGGEAFYRMVWRVAPRLKACCVLVIAEDAPPVSASRSAFPRIVRRPLTSEKIAAVARAFTRA